MIIGVIGANDFAVFHSAKEIIDDFASKNGSNSVIRLSADEIEVSDLESACREQSLFASSLLVVLRDVSKNSLLKEKLPKIMDTIPKTTTLLIWDTVVKKSEKLAKHIEKTGQLVHKPVLSVYALRNWVKSYTEENGAQIDSLAVNELLKRAGENQWHLSEEIKKLSLHDRKIGLEDVSSLVEESPQENIFHMLDDIMKGNHKGALTKYELLRSMQLEAQYIFSMLVWQAHNAVLVVYAGGKSSQEISEMTGISDYGVQKLKLVLTENSKPKVKQMVSQLIQADSLLKKTANNPDQIVKNAILKVCHL